MFFVFCFLFFVLFCFVLFVFVIIVILFVMPSLIFFFLFSGSGTPVDFEALTVNHLNFNMIIDFAYRI